MLVSLVIVFCCSALTLTIVVLLWASMSNVVCFVTAARARLSMAVPTSSCIPYLSSTALAPKLLSPVVILSVAFFSERAVRKNFLALGQLLLADDILVHLV